MKRRRFYTGPTCMHPVKDARGRAKLCGIPAGQARPVEGGGALWFCVDHAAEHDAARREPASHPPAPPHSICVQEIIDANGTMLCGFPARTQRTVDGEALNFCAKHAARIDANGGRMPDAKREKGSTKTRIFVVRRTRGGPDPLGLFGPAKGGPR